MWLSPLVSPAAWPTASQCSAASLFATLVASIVSKGIQKAEEEAKKTPDIVKGPYDFIVVGAGSAGCVLASRLSEVPHWRVLVLEAGAEETDYNMVPALYNRYIAGPFNDWQYSTQRSGWDAGRSIPRGKGMGGSSAVNAMHFTRGNAADFDHWNITDWTFEKVLPYFKKAENNLDPAIAKDTKYHGTGGPQSVQLDLYLDRNTELYMKALEELKFPKVEDVNGPKQLGVSRAPSSSERGERRSSNRGYLPASVRRRPNLTVQTGALVRRVLLQRDAKGLLRAVGVEYDGPAGRRQVRADKEVVVSAGSYNSPQVLMLSGVGPRSQLEEAGVAVQLDLPGVGQRLHDHMYAKGNVKWQLSKTANVGTASSIADAVKQYVEKRRGPLTGTGNQANLFYRSSHVAAGDPRPDIQVPLGGSQTSKEPKECAKPEPANAFYDQLGFNAINLHPRSRGQIRLNKTNPYGPPLILHNVFGDLADLKPIIEAFQLAVKLNGTKVFRDNGITLNVGSANKCSQHAFNSDAFWTCAFGGLGSPNGHPVASCSLGADGDAMAVVTTRLKVRGVGGLRVADASVLPETPSGNTNAVVIMVGERAADFIKQDWSVAADKKH